MIIAANSGWDEMSLQGVFILGITVLALTTGCVRDVERRQVEVLLNIFHSILKLPHTVHLLIPLNQLPRKDKEDFRKNFCASTVVMLFTSSPCILNCCLC